MNLNSLKQLQIISESVTIDITPLSLYGNAQDLAKITANIRLAAPLEQDTKFIVPNCDSITAPKIYLPDGQTVTMNDFDPTDEESINQLPALINTSLQEYLADPSMSNINKVVDYMATYSEFRANTSTITIPAGQQYITFTYSKYIPRDPQTGINSLDTIVPLSSFTLQNSPGSKANIIVLMPFEIQSLDNIIEAQWTAPNGQPQQLEKKVEAGRIMLTQYWQYDPSVVVKYKY
jgi:hypothetical protein